MVNSFDVFVSYGHADQVWVRALAENLESAGLHVFYDEWEIVAGDRLIHRLDAGIRGSTSGILVVSPHALSRPWVAEEYAAMLTRTVTGQQRLIPVMLKDAELPPFLASRAWVDFRHTHDPAVYTSRVRELVAGLLGQRRSRPAADGTMRPPPDLAYRVEGPRTAVLHITPQGVSVSTADGTVEGQPAGMDWSAGQVLRELDRVRTRRSTDGLILRAADTGGADADPLDRALQAAGRMLGERFLPADVTAALTGEIAAVVRGGVSLQLAVQTADAVADLPWETLTLPGQSSPLALHPSVQMYRGVAGLGATPAMGIPGPLRILAVIASPDHGDGHGVLLDYETELARILDAVDPARRKGEAYVRILNGGNRTAIRAALQQERFHILHLSCHAQPGRLVLEAEDGAADLVDTQTFAEQVLVAGRGVPLVVLAGCSTALGPQPTEGSDGNSAGTGADQLPGLARGLLARGVPAVLAMTAPVSDLYATDLASRFYGELSGRAVVDPLAALTDARQGLETGRAALPASDRRAGIAEWATPALFLRGPTLPLYNPADGFETIVEPAEPVLAEGIVVRRVGEFVGRRSELRTLRRALNGDGSGVVLHGIGGVGKSTLAAQLLADLGEEAGLVVSLTGAVAVDQILAAVAGRLASWCFAHNIDVEDVRRRLIDVLRSGTLWQERLGLVAEHLLPTLPVALLLDNAEDTLTSLGPGGGHRFTDPQLGAFLAAWVGLSSRARLLVTSRYPLPVDTATARRLTVHHLGPFSVAEARKLLWRLPALDALTPAEQSRAITDVGGHPRTLEYLDALLAGGQARFPEIATRLEHTLHARGIPDPAAWCIGFAGDVDRSLAETITLAVDDIVLDDLLARLDTVPLARRLLDGVAVYRFPVDHNGLAWQVAAASAPALAPDGDASLSRTHELLVRAHELGATTLEEAGLTDIQVHEYGEWVAQQGHLPLAMPDKFDTALTALLDLGLLTPVRDADNRAAFTVHRWTATALLARTTPNDSVEAHRRAASYWQWRAVIRPQSRLTEIIRQLEAGYHHLTAGNHDALKITTYAACIQLHTWGLWDWEEKICRHNLTRLPPRHRLSAAFIRRLGDIAQGRGDYAAAEGSYQQALILFEEIGDRAGVAASFLQLGRIAELRSNYAAAEDSYQQALVVFKELGDHVGVAKGYSQLGTIAQLRGDYTAAEGLHERSMAVFGDLGDLGDRAARAICLHQLGIIAQERGDYEVAEGRYQQALAIFEELGDRAGVARGFGQLGVVAYLRGDYEVAEGSFQQALAIFEEIG
ncbi:hypothetical protein CC117_30365, partial [Parafrankia colletiae]